MATGWVTEAENSAVYKLCEVFGAMPQSDCAGHQNAFTLNQPLAQ